jgi:RNA polymerase sigma factor (sigma-70 family)
MKLQNTSKYNGGHKMGNMIFDDNFVSQYSKKILGFAHKKTFNNTWDAEDLSQEILITLINALKNRDDIKEMDGFVYTVCCHVWSNFYRANKKHFKNNVDLDYAAGMQADGSPEDDFMLREDLEKLRKEVSYLSKIHREITVMYYYEEKKGGEIAAIMDIPHSTVRWHLSVIRKKLKEGFEMTSENLNFKPQKLQVGHSGNVHDWNMHGLGRDLIVQNIAIACYGEALTIEAISHKLGIAAAYLENHIKNLVYMDYLKVIGENKFQTNFFIREKKHSDYNKRYLIENIDSVAVKMHEVLEKHMGEIINIGFCGSDLDKNFLVWIILPMLVNSINWFVRKYKPREAPLRKDGSQHWVDAGFVYENSEKDTSVLSKAWGEGQKTRQSQLGVRSLQIDISATKVGWREFNGNDLDDLLRIKNIVEAGDEPNENDKLLISKMINMGYVAMVNSKPKIMIPFLGAGEYRQFKAIVDGMAKELGDDFAVEFSENYVKGYAALLPDFIEEEEKEYYTCGITPMYETLIYLAEKDYIKYPKDDEEAKRLCTFAYME